MKVGLVPFCFEFKFEFEKRVNKTKNSRFDLIHAYLILRAEGLSPEMNL